MPAPVKRHAARRSLPRLDREVLLRKQSVKALRAAQKEYGALVKSSRHTQEQLRLVTRRLFVAQEDERKRISHELHDGVVQLLVGINAELAALRQGAANGVQTLRSRIAHTQRLVARSVQEVHAFARELRPPVLDSLGLIPALQTYTTDFAKRFHMHVHVKAFEGIETLESDRRLVLFRVIQEALTNAARHAKAAHAQVELLQLANGNVQLSVHNDGDTFDVQKILHSKVTRRLGIIGMMERIEMIGGRFSVTSEPSAGTTVKAEIPFERGK